MKQQVLTLVRTFALLLVAGSAFGQTINVRANVPFDFIVSGKTLPAGKYAIRTNQAGNMLYVQSMESGNVTVAGAGYKVGNPDITRRSKLVFTKYGRSYFLHQVWQDGNVGARELPKSHREAALSVDYPLSSKVMVPFVR
jgi:hypothetical protein